MALGALAMLWGCSNSPEVGVREAVEQLRLENLEVPPLGIVVDRAQERAVRKALGAYDPLLAVSIIDRIYAESDEPTMKAKALAAAKLLLSDATPVGVRERVLALARAGLESENARVAFHALRLLLDASDGQPEDVRRVQQRLQNEYDPAEVIAFGYMALGRWRASEPILEQIFRPAPPETEPETDAYVLWRYRTVRAVHAWTAVAPRGEAIPARVAARLVHLMRADPMIAKAVAGSLVSVKALQMVPQLKAEVYQAELPLATKVLAGAAILALAPQDERVRQELPPLLKEFFGTRHKAREDLVDMWSAITWLSDLASIPGNRALLDELWDALGEAEDAERAQFLVHVVLSGMTGNDEGLVLHILAATSDADLTRLLAGSSTLRAVLRDGLLQGDVVFAFPRLGAPSRARQEERVRALLAKVAEQGEPAAH